jgi:hypothetical protein
VLELADFGLLIGYLLLVFAGSVLGGFLANLIYGYFGYHNLDSRLLSLENTIRGNKGVAVKAGKEQRMAAAIAEGAAMLQQGHKPADILKALAPRYPDVAMDMVKKLAKGEIPELEGLL